MLEFVWHHSFWNPHTCTHFHFVVFPLPLHSHAHSSLNSHSHGNPMAVPRGSRGNSFWNGQALQSIRELKLRATHCDLITNTMFTKTNVFVCLRTYRVELCCVQRAFRLIFTPNAILLLMLLKQKTANLHLVFNSCAVPRRYLAIRPSAIHPPSLRLRSVSLQHNLSAVQKNFASPYKIASVERLKC